MLVMRFLVRFKLFLMEIILPSGLKSCVVISKAASCGFMSMVTVLFQNKWTKKLIQPMPFRLRIENPFLSRPWFLLLQPLFCRLLLLFFPLPVHLPMFPKAKGIMSNDITIRSLFLSAVFVRTKVILLKPVTLVSVFFRTLLL